VPVEIPIMRKVRFSIAGLMGIVLVAAVGLAALRNTSPIWVGAIYLLTRAVLGLAVICAIYRRGAQRAWWIGFCLFGCGYVALVGSRPDFRSPHLPTAMLLVLAKPSLGYPEDSIPLTADAIWTNYNYLKIGHDLWALVAALIGGIVARIAFARSVDRPEPREAESPSTEQPSRKRWVRPTIIVWAGLVLAFSAATVRSAWNPGFWAGATFLLTCGGLGLACLGAIVGRGRRRQAWLGASVLGAGYLLLVFTRVPYLPLPSGQFLNALREWVPALSAGSAAANARILDALEQPVAMTFPDPTPLQDVLRYITTATGTPDYPGIPIYLDPIGLQEAEATPAATVTIDLRGIPLKTTLRLCLKQYGLVYIVKDGLLRVTSEDDEQNADYEDPFAIAAQQYWQSPATRIELMADLEDPFLIVGHCLLALLAAGFGAVAAPLVADHGTRWISSSDRT
jgi:hypothetical protein